MCVICLSLLHNIFFFVEDSLEKNQIGGLSEGLISERVASHVRVPPQLLCLSPPQTPLCSQLFFLFNFFLVWWARLWHANITRPSTEPSPQQRPKSQQWQCQILNPLSHQETHWLFLLTFNKIKKKKGTISSCFKDIKLWLIYFVWGENTRRILVLVIWERPLNR